MRDLEFVSVWMRLGFRDRRRRIRPYVLLLAAEPEPSDRDAFGVLERQAEEDAWRQLEVRGEG